MISGLINLLLLIGVALVLIVILGVFLQVLQQREARKDKHPIVVHKHHEGGRPV
jgi:hypothetical protein